MTQQKKNKTNFEGPNLKLQYCCHIRDQIRWTLGCHGDLEFMTRASCIAGNVSPLQSCTSF